MTTDRSYRRGRPPAEALVELRAHTGTQFNPVVVDALERVIGRTLAVPPAGAGQPDAKVTGSASTP